MDWTGWYCLSVLAVGVLIMAKDVMGPDFAMMGMLVIIMLPGERIISIEDALEGFANDGLLTVAVLFVMASGISETGGLDYAFTQLLGTPKTTRSALIRMVLPLLVISAFLNNSPVVMILIPIITTWSRKAGLAPGHLFMPLSFASILGGTITLIGTSTNLVVAGKQREAFPDDPPIAIFDLSPYGVPVALAGALYIILFATRLLPGKAKVSVGSDGSLEDAFLVGMLVEAGSPAIGRTLLDAGLRGLDGVYLTSVKRAATVMHAVAPDFIIMRDDVLFFSGDLTKVNTIAQRFQLRVVVDAFEEDLPALMGSPRQIHTRRTATEAGQGPSEQVDTATLLMAADPPHTDSRRVNARPITRLTQARVKKNAPDLQNVSVREAHFRTKFQASIVSIRREGHKLDSKLGDVVLQPKDQVLFDCGDKFDAASSIVEQNLTDIEVVEDGSDREFMFAFEVAVKGGGRTAEEVAAAQGSRSTSNMFDLSSRAGVAGKSIQAAGLRGLPDAFLVAIERGGTTLHAVAPMEVLHAGDVLWFAGSTAGVISLRKIPGLSQMDDQIAKLSSHVLDRRLVQVVLARTSNLLGKSVREARFRTQFNAAIVALHRDGHRIRQRIGDITLAAGDVLLLDTGSQFMINHKSDRTFALVAEVANSQPPRFDRVITALVCAIAAIVLYIAEVTELFTSAAMASGIMLLTGCLSAPAARSSIKWDIIVTIAAAFGISNALESTGAAKEIADLLVAAGRAAGSSAAIQVAMYVATVVLSNIIANNAAAALMFPIVMNVAESEGLDKKLMAYLLMLAASASFAVPFGYQTNLMVYGAGGYNFKNFLQFGGPMQVVLAVASLTVILLHEYVMIIWAVMGAATVAVCAGPVILSHCRRSPSKPRTEGALQEVIDVAEVRHRSLANGSAAIRWDATSERQLANSQQIV
eukprot:jgi/Ulvmu1/12180/UM085_0044.1